MSEFNMMTALYAMIFRFNFDILKVERGQSGSSWYCYCSSLQWLTYARIKSTRSSRKCQILGTRINSNSANTYFWNKPTKFSSADIDFLDLGVWRGSIAVILNSCLPPTRCIARPMLVSHEILNTHLLNFPHCCERTRYGKKILRDSDDHSRTQTCLSM